MAAILLLLMFVSLPTSQIVVASKQPALSTRGKQQHRKQFAPNDADWDAAALKPLPQFWASTGLCPPEPRNASGAFLLSRDTRMNLELIASLTDRGVRHVRIHWLLELLEISLEEGSFRYDFTQLDSFLDYVHSFGLYPAFELMGVPLGALGMKPLLSERFWTDLVQQLVERYSKRFGTAYVTGWRFETWNEPDLRNYNILNFTVDGYLTYVKAIRNGLDFMSRKLTGKAPSGRETHRYTLYGPAGLFKAETNHPFCWAMIKLCDSVHHVCPFDTITFHRKGGGRWASEVLAGGRQLIEELFSRFPNVRRLRFANDEADPIASWSTARSFQADVRYAAMLFSIVAQHWAAMADAGDRFGRHFDFLSHDNAFLSYHPYEFEQRTLLARFQMNETNPPHVQFVAKPVYSSLGMLAKLGPLASRTRFRGGNISYILSFDERSPPSYLCLLASRSNDSFPLSGKRSYFNVTIPVDLFRNHSAGNETASYPRLSYLIEAIQAGLNDPFRVWEWQGRPAYPTTNQLAAMRAAQLPTVLNTGGIAQTVQSSRNTTVVKLSLSLRGPWIVSVRVCSEGINPPGPVQRVRVRTVFHGEVLIFWTIRQSEDARCIQTYEVWFKASSSAVDEENCKWKQINARQHTPFTFFQYVATLTDNIEEVATPNDSISVCSGVNGYYKVRSIDMFNQVGNFSSVIHYNTTGSDYSSMHRSGGSIS